MNYFLLFSGIMQKSIDYALQFNAEPKVVIMNADDYHEFKTKSGFRDGEEFSILDMDVIPLSNIRKGSAYVLGGVNEIDFTA